MDEYFVKLNTVSKCVPALKSLIPMLEYKLVYGQNNAANLNEEVLKNDEKIYGLIKRFNVDKESKISIFKVTPNSCYNWHTDGIRCAAINMLLIGYNSMALMGQKDVIFFRNVEQVPYEPNRYVMINTSVSHSVYNFAEDRYLLSLGIPMEFSYQEVANYIKENEL